MDRIRLFQAQRNWDTIKDRVWELTNQAHDLGQAQNSDLVFQLEASLAWQSGRDYCVTTASCTDALIIALWCLGLPPRSRVAVSTYTFIATAHAIERAGHIAVPVDVDNNYCIDPRKVENCDAVVAVDIFGNMSHWDWLNSFEIPVICDAAQSLDSSHGLLNSVQHGIIACTSFSPSKPISCWGSGGALFTDVNAIAQSAMSLRLHGRRSDGQPYLHAGMNSMMSSFEAACVIAGIEQREQWATRRRSISKYLIAESQYLSAMDDLDAHSYSKLVFKAVDRDAAIKRLNDAGIETAVHYPRLIHQEVMYAGECPIAETLSAVSFTVPNQHTLTDDEVERIAKALR